MKEEYKLHTPLDENQSKFFQDAITSIGTRAQDIEFQADKLTEHTNRIQRKSRELKEYCEKCLLEIREKSIKSHGKNKKKR